MSQPPSSAGPARSRLPLRTRLALVAERAASGTSRRLGRGSGEMIGGKIALKVDPEVLASVASGRPAACVSGTNGKTTTTRLLAAALGVNGPVASNSGGANMTAGVIHALARPPLTSPAALEVDEIWLPQVARAVRPRAIALLNISRDQLDRSNETRRIAALWRTLGAELGTGPDGCTAVANCDDPLVVYAAEGFARQVWVSAGQNWTADAMVCPVDAALLTRDGLAWSCGSCGFARPTPEIVVTGIDSLDWRGRPLKVALTLPGRVNVGNAAIAAATAETFGLDVDRALGAMASLDAVQGRYSIAPIAPGRRARLLLAKNPAGWVEMLELLDSGPRRPVIVDFNSRTADGRDPSWLWDVPFERLAGRQVLVCGERREDVGVRLAYADVPHVLHDSVESAARSADLLEGDDLIDVVANYTAFRDLLRRVEPAGATAPSRAEPVR
ncbi:MAG TPA: MurT ligase domain-containing protein [Frankiaceae bacterium]|nr:MurT ligase domain-containing protein [Frankiaceae bacterium]